jgi:hypothetical protein
MKQNCAPQDWMSEVVLDPPDTTLPSKDPNWATLTMKFRTIIPQLIFPSISEGICPPQTAFLQNECYKQVRGSQRMITRHFFEGSIRECSGLIRKRVSSTVSCSWSRSSLEGLISSSTSAFRARELLCVIAIAQIQQFRFPIPLSWSAEVPDVMTRLENFAISTLSHNLHICTRLAEIWCEPVFATTTSV